MEHCRLAAITAGILKCFAHASIYLKVNHTIRIISGHSLCQLQNTKKFSCDFHLGAIPIGLTTLCRDQTLEGWIQDLQEDIQRYQHCNSKKYPSPLQKTFVYSTVPRRSMNKSYHLPYIYKTDSAFYPLSTIQGAKSPLLLSAPTEQWNPLLPHFLLGLLREQRSGFFSPR